MDKNGTGLGEQDDEWGEPKPKERTCLICGCTDSKACEGGCSWLRFEEIIHGTPDICSKCITNAVPECIDLLIETIMLTHQEEIDAEHHGDDSCSTCDLIKVARKVEAALKQ